MEQKAVDNPFSDLPAWLGGGFATALLAWFGGRKVMRLDKRGTRLDDAEETVDSIYKGVLGEARQSIEEHARDRTEWRLERAELKIELAECRTKHESAEVELRRLGRRLEELEKK
jgi:septal ring factor EnvC (AmiA/AmiB activator)